MEGGVTTMRTEGTPQAAAVSLLSNILLDDLDRELERRGLASAVMRTTATSTSAASGQGAGDASGHGVSGAATEVESQCVQERSGAPWERKFLGYSMTWHKKPKLKIAQQSASGWRRKSARRCGRRVRKSETSHRATQSRLAGWVAYFRLTEVRVCWKTSTDGSAQATGSAVAAMEACLHTGKEPDAAGLGKCERGNRPPMAWPMVERRRIAHERAYPKSWFDRMGWFVAGNPATLLVCFMNRRMPNGTSGGVGGRRE